jgi:hypothetical protein
MGSWITVKVTTVVFFLLKSVQPASADTHAFTDGYFIPSTLAVQYDLKHSGRKNHYDGLT